MKRIALFGTILASAALMAGCSPPGPPDPDAPLRVSGVLRIQEPALFEADDPLQLHRPVALAVWDGRIFIAENGAGRITVTDTLFGLLGRFGRPGRGPGELSGPMAITLTRDGTVAVADAGNSRYAFFTSQGEFLHFIRDDGSHLEVGVMGDSALVMAGRGGDEPRVLQATRTGVGPFSPSFGPAEDPIQTALDQTHALETEDGTRVVVLRVGTGVLELYDELGAHLRNDTLPASVLSRLQARSDKLFEAFEGPRDGMFGRKLISKPASRTHDGKLLILLPLEDPAGLVYDPAEGRFRPLLATQADARAAAVLRSAGYAHLEKNRLYVVTATDAVAILELEEG